MESIKEMDKAQLAHHLNNQGFPDKVTSLLVRESVDGRMFMDDYETMEDLDVVFGESLTRAEKHSLTKYRKRALERQAATIKGAETSDNIKKGRDAAIAAEEEEGQDEESNTKAPLGRERYSSIVAGLQRQGLRYQEPRQFLKPEGELAYAQGIPFRMETGYNSGEPSREYKEFDMADYRHNKSKVEDAFIKRASKFAIACLNARCNGTLYYGVADNHTRNYVHGEVRGCKLSTDEIEMLQTFLSNNLTGPQPKLLKGGVPTMPPEMKQAIQECTMVLRAVSVLTKNGDDGLYVLEIDIYPRHFCCRDMIFFLPGKAHSSTMKGDQSRNTLEVNTYYFRQDTSTLSFRKKSDLSTLKEKVGVAIERLRSEERKRLFTDNLSVEDKLVELLSRGRSSGLPGAVKDLSYVLVLNDSSEDQIKNLEWLLKLNYVAIFDLGAETDSGRTAFGNEYKKEVIREACYIDGASLFDELQKKDVASFLADTEVGGKTLYLSCNTQGDHRLWKQTVGRSVASLIAYCFNHIHMESMEKVVVLYVIKNDGLQKELADISRYFCNTSLNCDQYICLSDESVSLETFDEPGVDTFGYEDWSRMRIKCNWDQLNESLMKKLEHSKPALFQLPGSRYSVDIPAEILDHYSQCGITIWPMGQNAYIDENLDAAERQDFNELCRTKVIEFLRGKDPEWYVFHASEPSKNAGITTHHKGLVQRDHLKVISEKLRELRREDKSVVSLVVKHRPGAGATTVGRNILWAERETKRCVAVDAGQFTTGTEVDLSKLEKVAGLLMKIRRLGEDDDAVRGAEGGFACKPVLILFDNATENLAKKLESYLLRRCTSESVTTTYAFVLLALVSTFESDDAEEPSQKHKVGRGKLVKSSLLIQQELSQREKRLFEDTLKSFLGDQDNYPDDMLGFVIMAENFNEESVYVKNVVKNTLCHMTSLYPTQARLLLYLALLKYHANAGLPERHCEKFCFPILRFAKVKKSSEASCQAITFLPTFSPHFLMFVKTRKRFAPGCFNMNGQDCTFMEMTHVPVAIQVFRELALQEPLSGIVKSIVTDNILVNEPFLKEVLHTTLRILLTKRSFQDQVKNKFANVIMKIQAEESQEDAEETFQVGFEQIEGDSNKAYIGQALARFFCESLNFKKAKEWAEKAREHAMDNFAVADTAGQVHRREMKHLKEELGKSASYMLTDCEAILTSSRVASDYFKLGHKFFRETLARLKQLEDNNCRSKVRNMDSEASTNNPGLYGLINCNLMAMQVILSSEDLAQMTPKNMQVRELFLRKLRGEVSDDLSSILPFLSWEKYPWPELSLYISSLCNDTRHFIREACTRLGYVRTSDSSYISVWQDLERYVKEFNEIFGTDISRVDEMLKKRRTPEDKIVYLRRLLYYEVTSTFGRLMGRNTKIADIMKYIEVLKMLLSLSKKHKKPILNEDKLSYVNLSLAYAYQIDGDCSYCPLDGDTAKTYCYQLVQADYASPEPYFAFVMLYWSQHGPGGEILDGVSESDMVLLKKSLGRLSDYEFEYSDVALLHSPKPRPIFVLGRPRGQHFLNRFLSTKNSPTYHRMDLNQELIGKTDKSGDVWHNCGEEDVRVRSARLNYRNRGGRKSVKFNLGFCFDGPVAYNLDEETDEDDEMRKIEAKMSGRSIRNK